MRSRDTIEFLCLWESLHNPNFKHVEFNGVEHGTSLQLLTIYKQLKRITYIKIKR